jgi:uncharacterized protein YeaO (DUF488 family)
MIMSKSDRVARDGEAVPEAKAAEVVQQDIGPASDFRAALGAFTKNLGAFRAGMEAKLQQQEERLTMLDRKSMAGLRPALAAAARTRCATSKGVRRLCAVGRR